MAQTPVLDARAYWDRAAEIAAGQWRDSTPFMGAPLYPYLLAVVRAAGGGITAAVVPQVLMHLATIVLLAWAARQRFGCAAGWLAAGLYAFLLEPAFYAGRLLNCSLQALLVSALLVALLRAQRSGHVAAWGAAGVLLGLAALASPPMLLALPLLTLLALTRRPLRAGLVSAAAFAIGAAIAIAPATIHNYSVSRELILVSAQAGITFAQGNSPGATGIYNQLPGISRDRRQQNQDVLRVARQQLGPAAGWNDASGVFFRQGSEYLREDLQRAATLVLRKLAWFVASDIYGDIYLPAVERAEGIANALWLAPLPLPWLAGLATCGMILWLRRPVQFAPELILVAIPLITVLAFFYSPRYRFPVAPLAAIAAAGSIIALLRYRPRGLGISALVLAAAAGPILSVSVTRAKGPLHDTVDSWRAPLRQKLAKIALDEQRFADAARDGQRAVDLEPNDALARQILGAALEGVGRSDEAVAHYRRAAELDPHLLEPHFRLGELLMKRGRLKEGLAEFEEAVRIAPQTPDAYLRRAQARAATGRIDLADADVERAIVLAREQGQESAAAGYREWWDSLKSRALRPK